MPTDVVAVLSYLCPIVAILYIASPEASPIQTFVRVACVVIAILIYSLVPGMWTCILFLYLMVYVLDNDRRQAGAPMLL